VRHLSFDEIGDVMYSIFASCFDIAELAGIGFLTIVGIRPLAQWRVRLEGSGVLSTNARIRSEAQQRWWVGLALSVFVATRLWILLYPETRHSTMSVYVTYAFEAASAEREHRTLYDIHADNARRHESAIGHPLERGAGVVEYPPLAISWMRMPALILGLSDRNSDGLNQWTRAYLPAARIGLAAVDLVCLALTIFILRGRLHASDQEVAVGVGSYALTGVFLYALVYDRMDLVMTTLVVAALAALTSRLPYVISFALLATAINFKLVAIFIAPVWLIGSLPCGALSEGPLRVLRALALRVSVLGGLTCLVLAPYFAINGGKCLEFLKYHSDRGIQLESLTANVALLASRLGVPVGIEHSYGSTNITAPGSFGLMLCATAWIVGASLWAVWSLWRTVLETKRTLQPAASLALAAPEVVIRYSALLIALAMCGSKVFSAQYMLWLVSIVPLVRLGSAHADRRLQLVFLLTCAFTLLVYPALFDSAIRPIVRINSHVVYLPPSALGLLCLTARNSLFVWMTLLLSGRARPSTVEEETLPCRRRIGA
jgi:hypothetical protein